jgi:ElaB/YqjD/DUF883 family membrane-anchored ribosome-binding protein
MTHSIDAPFPPPPSTGSGATSATSGTAATTTTSTTTGSPSTSDVAKDEARNVGQTAAQAGSQVASTAADQAKEVAHETQRQAQDLLHQGRHQLRQQTVAQQQKAASGLTSLAQELRGLADGSSQGAPGPARDLLQQASGYVEQFADRLQNREPADLLDDVRAFARRRPGTFLLGAALAGVLAGRLTSGVKAAHSDDSSTSGTQQYRSGYAQTNYVDPAPAYSGYAETTAYETTTGYTGTPTTGTPVPPPPYGTVPPEGAAVPPTTPAGWDDPTRRPGQGV